MSQNTILVVDDEQSILSLFDKAFTRRGYTVHTAGSGEEALERIEENHYWVVLTDLRLPKMDGLEFCRRAKNDFPFTVVLGMTGFVSVYGLSACLEAGFEDCFLKPVNLEVVTAEIDHAFAKTLRWRSGQSVPE